MKIIKRNMGFKNNSKSEGVAVSESNRGRSLF